ncbi:4,5-DOPA dioxygenase extradiol [Fusarium oxysporum f. sp. albedinis]|nr:4,5-DOPA dioxygenase extradiol [Fusarium oxysporum f. sp. albedinis]
MGPDLDKKRSSKNAHLSTMCTPQQREILGVDIASNKHGNLHPNWDFNIRIDLICSGTFSEMKLAASLGKVVCPLRGLWSRAGSSSWHPPSGPTLVDAA